MRANERAAKFEPIDELCDVPCFNGKQVARLRGGLPSEEELADMEVLFSALADRTRLKVFHALGAGGELCVCDVAHVLNVSLSTASHHLRKLRDLRLLRYRNDGRMSYYSLREPLAGWLVQEALRAQREQQP